MGQQISTELCNCMDDRVHHRRCETCGEELEICDKCGKPKTEHCEESTKELPAGDQQRQSRLEEYS